MNHNDERDYAEEEYNRRLLETADGDAPARPVEHDEAMTDDLKLVIVAAERRAAELLNQASEYERKGFQPTAQKILNEHYRPLRNAINRLITARPAQRSASS